MSLAERILKDYQEAARAGDAVRVGTLRLLRAALKDAEIERRGPLDDPAVVQVIQRQARQRRESIDAYRAAGRTELADREAAELAVLTPYLPAGLTPDELRALVQAAIAEVGASSPAELGAVMRVVMPRVQGRADGAQVSALVRELLTSR